MGDVICMDCSQMKFKMQTRETQITNMATSLILVHRGLEMVRDGELEREKGFDLVFAEIGKWV